MDDLDSIEIALIVNLGTFRSVLRSLRVGGKSWWTACNIAHVAENGSLIVGFWEPQCSQRNAVFFRVPVLHEESIRSPDELHLVFAPALIEPVDVGYGVQPGRLARDCIGDFERFFFPVKHALSDLLRAAG